VAIIISSLILSEVAFALTFTDKLKRRVNVVVPVKRAIIVVGCELIPALDIWDQVVGVSDWVERNCDIYRAFVLSGIKQKKALVGPGIRLNIEAILRLNPDLVITWSYDTRIIRFLQDKGIKVIAIYPDSIQELYDVIRLFGRLFGKEKRAEEVIKEMDEIFELIRLRTSNIKKRKKVIYLGGKPTTVSGKIGISNDLIRLIGGINVGSEINARYADVSIEKIIGWNPDIIFIWGYAGYNEEWLYNNSQWKFIKAVRERDVYKLPEWSTWSPRLSLIALYMAIRCYPDIFKDINFEKISDQFYRKVFGISYEIVKEYEGS